MNYIISFVCCTLFVVGATDGGLLPESSHAQRSSSKGPLASSADPSQGWSTDSNGVESTGVSTSPDQYTHGGYQQHVADDILAFHEKVKADVEAQAKLEALWKAKQEAFEAIEKEKAARKAAEASEKELEKLQSYVALLKAQNVALAGPFTGVSEETNKPYFGPLAMLRVLPSGFIADTPEVAAAKANHLAALASVRYSDAQAKAQAQTELALWQAKEEAANTKAKAIALWKAEEDAVWRVKHAEELVTKLSLAKANVDKAKSILSSFSSSSRYLNKPWFGPLAMLQVLPNGFIADTADVTAAKKSHLQSIANAEAAYARAKAKEQADIALWKAKEAELKAKEEADIALWKAELKALAKQEADLAAWKAKEAELNALAKEEAELAAWKAKEAELKALAKEEADIAAWQAKEAEKKEAWKAKQQWK